MGGKHAPKNVYETRDGYRCEVCGEEVVRYSTPRAVWKHREPVAREAAR